MAEARDTGISESLFTNDSTADDSIANVDVAPTTTVVPETEPSTVDIDALSPVRTGGSPDFPLRGNQTPTDVASAARAPLCTENVSPPGGAAGAARSGMVGAAYNPAFTDVHLGARPKQPSRVVPAIDPNRRTLPRKPWADLQAALDSSDDEGAYADAVTRQSLEHEIKRLKYKYYVAKGKALARQRYEREHTAVSDNEYHSASNSIPASAPRTACKTGGEGEETQVKNTADGNSNVVRDQVGPGVGPPCFPRLGSKAVDSGPGNTGPVGRQAPTRVEVPDVTYVGVAEAATGGVSVASSVAPGRQSLPGNVRPLKPLKLEKFDGSSVPLETFLAKLENASVYNLWCERDKLVFLRDALTGDAGQVLWELPSDATSDDIITLLRTRFGNAFQVERFRAELQTRRRQPGETIQTVYNDIRRLLSLAYPKEKGEMYESIGRDAFLAALDDPQLRIRALDRCPKTLDETLSMVIQMDVRSRVLNPSSSAEEGANTKQVRSMSSTEIEADRRIKRLEESLKRQTDEIKKLRQQASRPNNNPCVNPVYVPAGAPYAGGYCYPNPPDPNLVSGGQMSHMTTYPYSGSQYVVNGPVPRSAQQPPTVRSQSAGQGGNRAATSQQLAQPQRQGDQSYNSRERGGYYSRGRHGRRSYDNRRSTRDECWRCGQRGHYRSECPVPAYTLNQIGNGGNANDSQTMDGRTDDRNVNLLSCRNEAETYIDINLKGRTVQALLDTGSDLSICPLRLCKNVKITPVTIELYAANETSVKVLGQTRIHFSVGNLDSYADVLVSDQVDELLLGFDYMKRNNCSWLFDKDRLIIHGHSVPLQTRQNKAKGVRRCFVKETVVIPPDTAINVPVRLPFHNLREPVTDWIVENKQVRPGVLTARTLLPHNSDYAAVAILNMSGVEQVLKSGLEIGRARICPRKLIAKFDCVNENGAECMSNDGRDGVAVDNVDCDNDDTPLKRAKCDDNESFQETALRQQVVPHGTDNVCGGRDSDAARVCACEQTSDACRCTHGSGELDRLASCRESRQTIGLECGINDAGIPSAVYASRAVGEDVIQETDGDHRPADLVHECADAEVGGRLPGGQRARAAAAARSCDGTFDGRPTELATLSTDGAYVSATPLVPEATDLKLRPRPTAAKATTSGVEAAPTANKEDRYPFMFVDSTLNPNSVPFVPSESCVMGACDVDNVANHVSVNVGSEPAVKRLYTVHSSLPSETSHVQPVIDRLPDCLSPEQKVKAIELIKHNADVFSRHEFDVGCTDLMTASIDTGSSRSIAEPLRRHARGHLDIIDETIDKMEAAGIVSKCSSPWSFNLVVVSRYDDQGKPTTPRITIDYRKLNAITCKDRYPLPNIKDCLQSLSNVSWLSSMDISSAFYQVLIRDEDKDKTAFLTRRGQYRLERMAMGLTNSPAHFARLMSCLLRGLKCCLAFLDDTLCFSTTFDDHLSDLQLMFDRFRAANLKLKPKKCKLFQTETDFLGHHVSRSGMAPQQAKVACVQNWPFPTNITELRAYLGLCSYYRSYIKGFATIAEPLTECLRRGVALEKTPRRVEAFEKLKASLMSAPILAVPRDDPECRYVIDTDASNHSAGAVCQQWQDGKLRVIEYASRVFSPAERRYCATRREMASVTSV